MTINECLNYCQKYCQKIHSKWQDRVSIIARINSLVHLEYADYMYKNGQNIVKKMTKIIHVVNGKSESVLLQE